MWKNINRILKPFYAAQNWQSWTITLYRLWRCWSRRKSGIKCRDGCVLMLERVEIIRSLMWDIFSFSFWLILANPWLMPDVFSAFLSATILPGNSRNCVCLPGCAKSISQVIIKCGYFWLVFLATAGNTLGSLTTYWIGRWFPKIDSKMTALCGR